MLMMHRLCLWLTQLMLMMLAVGGDLRNGGPADAHDAGLRPGAVPADAHAASSCWGLAQQTLQLMLLMFAFV